MDEARVNKDDVIRYVLEENRIPPEDALLIGDRLHDAEGARAVGIPCIGVLWGYGDRQELSAAGAAGNADDQNVRQRGAVCFLRHQRVPLS